MWRSLIVCHTLCPPFHRNAGFWEWIEFNRSCIPRTLVLLSSTEKASEKQTKYFYNQVQVLSNNIILYLNGALKSLRYFHINYFISFSHDPREVQRKVISPFHKWRNESEAVKVEKERGTWPLGSGIRVRVPSNGIFFRRHMLGNIALAWLFLKWKATKQIWKANSLHLTWSF